ncbi:hypothetical protein EV356DRAFT_533601 [Viridothelium virens]|uniref:STAS domain-containing protein n=1 Tax=Viridothelium virens TaxID=1048519 RepID=A0A6A6H7C7_VIRVR|nr:hypothetical protein EV356DRAFT_533601 [Viridothelium virens]
MSQNRRGPPPALKQQPQHQQRGQVSPDASVTSPSTIQHAPVTPSKLRTLHYPGSSPEESSAPRDINESSENGADNETGTHVQTSEHDPQKRSPQASVTSPTRPQRHSREPSEPNVRTRLLSHKSSEQQNNYGTEQSQRSSRPHSPKSYGSSTSITSQNGFGGIRAAQTLADDQDAIHHTLGDAVTDGLLGGQRKNKPTPTHYLAKRHGVKHSRMIYLFYYIPIINWIRQYKWSYLQGDLVAALTMASFYIPMSLSYASNLGHIPPINGLYAFVFNPVIYAILGTCPLMVVGPEAAGSLLTGQAVRENINRGRHRDDSAYQNAQIAGTVTGLAGAIILLAGITRLGFLDNVLSRPFLRGFISAIGIVILVDQLIPEMGLAHLAAHDPGGAAHGSSLDKIIFLVENAGKAHGLTCAVSFGSFAIIMTLREMKRRLQSRINWVAYVPDRFLVVVLSAVFAWKFDWASQGLEIMGSIEAKGSAFKFDFPFDWKSLTKTADAFSTAFLIALLGFFESSVAAKSLAAGGDNDEKGLKNITLSPNRELVALGVANVVGGCFMALPAFGGYGRSKVNVSTGGMTPMSSVFLSIIAVICVLFLLPYFEYIPKGVLSAMISVVAWSLLEEIPHDLFFFLRIRGIQELSLMSIIFLVTFFFDLKAGIAVGIGLSLLRLVRHSTRPRIQILGRVPGTRGRFENAEVWRAMQNHNSHYHSHGNSHTRQTSTAPTLCETHPSTPMPELHDRNPMDAITAAIATPDPTSINTQPATARSTTSNASATPPTPSPPNNHHPPHPHPHHNNDLLSSHSLEFIPGTLIIKIPEPLFFANTGSLRARLSRLEAHGTPSAHPALPRVRSPDQNRVVVFDVHGVTSLDGAGAQVLADVVRGYVERGVGVWFSRLPGVAWSTAGGGGGGGVLQGGMGGEAGGGEGREGEGSWEVDAGRRRTFKAEGEVWELFRSSGIVACVGGERHFLNSVEEAIDASEEEERRRAQEAAFGGNEEMG